jgi:hypothetical protein
LTEGAWCKCVKFCEAIWAFLIVVSIWTVSVKGALKRRGDGPQCRERPEALNKLPEQDKGMQQRVDAQVSKRQPRGALPAGGDRPVDGLEGVFAKDAFVAQALDLDEPAIGCKPISRSLGRL